MNYFELLYVWMFVFYYGYGFWSKIEVVENNLAIGIFVGDHVD